MVNLEIKQNLGTSTILEDDVIEVFTKVMQFW